MSKYEDDIDDILNKQSIEKAIPSIEELKERLAKTRELLAMANQCDRGQALKKHLKLCETLLKSIRCHDCVRAFAESINELNELYGEDSNN